MLNKSIKRNAVLSSVKTILSLIVPLITFPYISRILQVEAIGRYNFSNSVVGYFVLLAELGIGTYALREGARIRDNRELFSVFASEMLTFNLLSAGFSLLLLFVSAVFIPKLQEYSIFLAILSVQIPLAAFGRTWIFNVYEEFGILALIQAAFQLLSTVLLFLFVHSPSDVYMYTVIYTLSAAASNLLYGTLCKKHMDLKRVSFSCLRPHIKPILIIFSTTVTTVIYVNSDITILGWLVNDEAVGLYSTAVKVYNIVKQVILAVITVIIPRLTLYAETEHFNSFFNKVLKTLSLLILPAMTGLFLLSENVIDMIAGPEYLPAAMSLRLLSIALGLSLFACLFASGVLLPNMQETPFLIATIISAAANIILNFILIPQFHQNAAAFTTVIAEFLVLIICYGFARKYISLKSVAKPLLSVGVGCGAIIAVCLAIKALSLSLYPETILCVCLSVAAYCLVQLILKNEAFLQAFNSVLKMLKKKR